jgi:hypothetical protein
MEIRRNVMYWSERWVLGGKLALGWETVVGSGRLKGLEGQGAAAWETWDQGRLCSGYGWAASKLKRRI